MGRAEGAVASGQALLDAALVASLAAVAAGGVGAVVARKAVHMIAWLVVMALGVASVLALMGYGYIAVFHVVVYIGTSVTLLAVVVMLVGCSVEPRTWRPGRLLLAFMAAAALEAPLLFYALENPVPSTRLGTGVGLEEAARQLLDCWLCTVLMVITVATVLIEALAIARGGAGPAGE